MKNRLIFDTGAFFLYFAEDKQIKEIFDEVASGKAEGYTCETNMAEFYYKTCEKFSIEAAEIRHTSIRHSKIIILTIDERLTRAAGNLKCVYRGKLSLADAHIVATAKMLEGTLITTDQRLAELKLAQTKLYPIP